MINSKSWLRGLAVLVCAGMLVAATTTGALAKPGKGRGGGGGTSEPTDAATDYSLFFKNGGFNVPTTVKYRIETGDCTTVSGSCDPGAQMDAIKAGMAVWEEVTDVTFDHDDAGAEFHDCSTEVPNRVHWQSIDGPGGFIAAAVVCRQWTGKSKATLGFTLRFDADEIWSHEAGGVAASHDIQAWAANLTGQAMGLGTLTNSRAEKLTMYYSPAAGDIGARTLGCGDRLGLNALYGTTLNCSVLPGD